jgi:hypothetical protein
MIWLKGKSNLLTYRLIYLAYGTETFFINNFLELIAVESNDILGDGRVFTELSDGLLAYDLLDEGRLCAAIEHSISGELQNRIVIGQIYIRNRNC